MDMYNNMDELQKYIKLKKAYTKSHILCDFIFMKFYNRQK